MYRCIECGTEYEHHVSPCTSCLETNSVVPMGRRVRALVDYVPEVTDARSLLRETWQVVATSAYPTLQLRRGALVVLTGGPGDGKSTTACRALDGLKGTVVLASIEEPPGPSLAARLARAGVRRDDFGIVGRASVDQLVEVCRLRGAVGLAIDSVQPGDFHARDLRHLLAVLPRLEVLFAVSQNNKRGAILGENALAHEADVVIKCEAMRWSLTKSRYQPIDQPDARGEVLRGGPTWSPLPEVANDA